MNNNNQTPTIKISIVIICYNMQREIIRTIKSLLPPYQIGIKPGEIELIVIDNGSEAEIDFGDLRKQIVFYQYPNPNKSPARAINFGIDCCSANLIGVFIDGARMASPGLCQQAIMANQISNRSVVSTLALHLGPDVQMKSVFNGYNQNIEDKILKKIDWYHNGYALFSISSLAASGINGIFSPMTESNGIFMQKHMWNELNGFNEQFECSGGGLLNLDIYCRICELENSEFIILLAEATFHQVHGGIATNQRSGTHKIAFEKEYTNIYNKDFKKTKKVPICFGSMNPHAKWVLEKSLAGYKPDFDTSKIHTELNNLFINESIKLSYK